MQAVIRENVPEDIWTDSPLVEYRRLGNTNRGEVGEQFVRRYLGAAGIRAGNGNRTSATDMTLGSRRVEVKTASLGSKGTFQFNHIRLDKRYDFLLCLGICPHQIVFNVWRKERSRKGKLAVSFVWRRGKASRTSSPSDWLRCCRSSTC